MMRIAMWTIVFSLADGARSWTSMIVDPGGFSNANDPGRDPSILRESDPHLTRTTSRPTGSPTITPEPTSYPSAHQPTNQPSLTFSVVPSKLPSDSPSWSAAPSTSASPSLSSRPTGTLTPSSLEPSYTPGTVPTSAPSRRIDNSNGNGGCAVNEVLHEVILYDQFGDGWDSQYLLITRLGDNVTFETEVTQHINGSLYLIERTVHFSNGGSKAVIIKINNSSFPIKSEVLKQGELPGVALSTNPVFNDTLVTGDVGIGYACLQPGRCYQTTILGGRFADEISWEIRQSAFARYSEATSAYSPIVNGGAPSNCTFSVPGNQSAVPRMFCPSNCHLNGRDPLQSTGPSSAPVPTSTPLTNPLISQSPQRESFYKTSTLTPVRSPLPATFHPFWSTLPVATLGPTPLQSNNQTTSRPTLLPTNNHSTLPPTPPQSHNRSTFPPTPLQSNNHSTFIPAPWQTKNQSTIQPTPLLSFNQSSRAPASLPLQNQSSGWASEPSVSPSASPTSFPTMTPTLSRTLRPSKMTDLPISITENPTIIDRHEDSSPISGHDVGGDDPEQHEVTRQDGGSSYTVKPAYGIGGERNSS